MASRPRTTHKKRERELALMERQREKMAKRLQRKNEPRANPDAPEVEEPAAQPEPETQA